MPPVTSYNPNTGHSTSWITVYQDTARGIDQITALREFVEDALRGTPEMAVAVPDNPDLLAVFTDLGVVLP